MLFRSAMVEDEGAALGGALQAAWCVSLHEGNRRAKLADFTGPVVAVRAETRCQPRKVHVARYRELQALQDGLASTLRDSGHFTAQRALAR